MTGWHRFFWNDKNSYVITNYVCDFETKNYTKHKQLFVACDYATNYVCDFKTCPLMHKNFESCMQSCLQKFMCAFDAHATYKWMMKKRNKYSRQNARIVDKWKNRWKKSNFQKMKNRAKIILKLCVKVQGLPMGPLACQWTNPFTICLPIVPW